ncbi:hypothetical protein C8R45DRAFT_1094682 [Mycena sanguinolenta]|nr:hypothetical protein C8R45DRAFT_1094682 [Mycena sanguinolenta]
MFSFTNAFLVVYFTPFWPPSAAIRLPYVDHRARHTAVQSNEQSPPHMSVPNHRTHISSPQIATMTKFIDENNEADPLLRVKLFLSVLTGSTLPPVKPTCKVKCLIVHDWSEDYPTTDVDGRDDIGPDGSISLRSCFQSFTITNNARTPPASSV